MLDASRALNFLDEMLAQYKQFQIGGLWTGVANGNDVQDDAVFTAGTSSSGKGKPLYCSGCGQLSASCTCGSKDTADWSPPTSACTPVSTSPLRFSREIRGKTMKWCAKCFNRKNRDTLGRWNTTHWTDTHKGFRQPKESANLADTGAPDKQDEKPAAAPAPTWAERLSAAQK